jgi:hypothetical protein
MLGGRPNRARALRGTDRVGVGSATASVRDLYDGRSDGDGTGVRA